MEDLSLEDSLKEPACIDDVIFYGPMTTFEERTRGQFEKRLKEKKARAMLLMSKTSNFLKKSLIPRFESSTFEENMNETVNQSVYDSFSIDESKYESFEDSLDEEEEAKIKEVNASQFLTDQVRVSVRKNPLKQKCKINSLCDSLEDIHSLVSNVEKLSFSEEIEDIIFETNAYEDSLRNENCVKSKNITSSGHFFDDDSLAIPDIDKTFDDSLEENDVLTSYPADDAAIVSSSDADKIMDQLPLGTSISVIYENVISSSNVHSLNQVSEKTPSCCDDVLSKDSLEDERVPAIQLSTSALPFDEPKSSSSSISVYLSASDDLGIVRGCVAENCDNTASKNIVSTQNDPEECSSQAEMQVYSSSNPVSNNSSEQGYPPSPQNTVAFVQSVGKTSKNISNHGDKNGCINDSVNGLDSNSASSGDNVKLDLTKKTNEILNASVSNLDCIFSPFVENQHKILNSEPFQSVKKFNETIFIDDSFELPSIEKEGKVHLTSASHHYDVKCEKETNEIILIEDYFTMPPDKFEQDLGATATNVFSETVRYNIKDEQNMNETIQIEDSFALPSVKSEKEFCPRDLFSGPMQCNIKCEQECNETIVIEDSFIMPENDPSKQVSISPELSLANTEEKHSFKIKNEHENIGSVLKSFQSSGYLKSDSKLTLQLDVAFSDKEGINIISISPLKIEEKCLKNKIDVKKTKEAAIKSTAAVSSRPISTETEDCDVQLLQALDLHDSSVASEVSLQLRDSMMPLNLCTRERSHVLNARSLHSPTDGKENVPCDSPCPKSHDSNSSDAKVKKISLDAPKIATPEHLLCTLENAKSEGKPNSATKIPIRKNDSRLPLPACQKSKRDLKTVFSKKCFPLNSITPAKSACSQKCDETPKKLHHFCLVRNSISKVPQPTPKAASKKFKNIESPVAKYIKNPNAFTPLKASQQYDGNVLAQKNVPTSKQVLTKGPVN